MTTDNGNGTGISKTVSWIMALIAALLVAMGGFILQGFNSRLASMETLVTQQGNAVARLEANQQSSRERDAEIMERLKDIDRKLDELRGPRWQTREK